MKERLTTILFLFVLCTFVPLVSGAQGLESLGGGQGTIAVRTNPPHPGPNQPVTVTIESYATDLDRSEISWIVSGTEEQKGIGQKRFSFRTGGPGSLSSVLITVKAPNGSIIQESLNIWPASIDLVWEARSYTPPFYKGKALYPYQGTVKVVALPNIVTETGTPLNSKNLVYTWKIDGNTVAEASGYGKDSLTFNGSIPIRPAKIEVEASSIEQTYAASAVTTITPVSPYIALYEDSPLYGTIYDKNLSTTKALQNEELRVVAIPYFIGTNVRDGGDLEYKWQINGQNVGSGGGKSSITFRQETGAGGAVDIRLQVTNVKRIFQFANTGLTLSFGEKAQARSF